MFKIFTKENLKKVLIFFLLIQPFLDTYILFEEGVVNFFGFSPSTIIRLLFIGIIGIFLLFTIKSKKQWIGYSIYSILLVLYTGVHVYNATTSISLDANNFNFSVVSELFYIIRLIIPFVVIVATANVKFKKEHILKLFNVLVLLFSGTIVVTNLLKISIGAYETKIIKYNIIDWFTTNLHASVTFLDTATRAYFSFANMISSLLFGFTAILFYELFKEFNYKKVFLIVIQMLAMFMLGTKVATAGFLLSMIASLVIYLFFVFIKKEQKLDYKILAIILILTISWFAIYPSSPCNNRSNMVKKLEFSDDDKEEPEKKELEEEGEFDKLTEKEKGEFVKKYVAKNYVDFAIKEEYILKKYPYEQDAYFWYNMFSASPEVKSDNRLLTMKIYNRLKELNEKEKIDNLFGISYSRASNIVILERDFLAQYYYLGTVGSALLVYPYIIILFVLYGKMLLDKKKFNLKNNLIILSLASAFIGAAYCGNTLDNLTFTIVYAFVIGVAINEVFSDTKKRKRE